MILRVHEVQSSDEGVEGVRKRKRTLAWVKVVALGITPTGLTSRFLAEEELQRYFWTLLRVEPAVGLEPALATAPEAAAEAELEVEDTELMQYFPVSSFVQTASLRGVIVYRTSYIWMTASLAEEVSSAVQAE